MRAKNILIFSEPARTYDRNFLRGIVRYSSKQGHWNFYGDMLIHPSYVPTIKRGIQFDGIITCDSPSQHLDSLSSLNLPILTYRSRKKLPGKKEILVVTDHLAIGKTAARYYKQLGYKHFAYLGSPTSYWTHERLAGFREELPGCAVHVFTHPVSKKSYDWGLAIQKASVWLAGLPRPAALFAGSDEWGRFALNLCLEEGLSIPFDISVLGANDDSLICDFCYKPLSSIRLDVEHAGYLAAEQFHRLICGKTPEKTVISLSPLMVVERQSTGCFAANDPYVTRAIGFIKENFTNDIHVEQIARIAGISRRSLENRFKKVTGETLAGAIRRIRADYACKLLLETELAIYEIAHKLGYDDEKHFSRYFRNEKGLSPSDYRYRR
jgi:LacI family transcriptional regulator